MDDLILAGTVSLIGLYAAVFLVTAGSVLVLLQLSQAVGEGNAGRVAMIIAGIVILAAAYAGAGLWLQKSDRI